MRNTLYLVFIVLWIGATGCDEEIITTPSSEDPGSDAATLPPIDGPSDAATDETDGDASTPEEDADSPESDTVEPLEDGTTSGTSGAPEGYATLTFEVDDSANQTYEGGQMRWTGSFAWDEATNTIEYASSWLPEDGPYPSLYDDGPRSEGGHEKEGAVAGDSIFSTEVYVKADTDLTFEYGLLNEFNNWIWIGPNGMIEIPTGSTEIYELSATPFPPFGTVDAKLTLDINALHESMEGAPVAKVFVKGTLNSWAPVQILDNGEGADDVADDGIYSYYHSSALGPHDGLLLQGQEVQFVFMLGLSPEAFAADALEYKAGGDALPDGVEAFTDAEEAGTWAPVDVILLDDSKGKTKNTGFVVPGEAPAPVECETDTDCGDAEICTEGICTDAPTEPECEDDAGCGDNEACVEGVCVEAEVPACESSEECQENEECVDGTCVPTPIAPCVEDGDCEEGLVCLDGACEEPAPEVSAPEIFLLNPTSGTKEGGTSVSILGVDFQDGATVLFDGIEASSVSFTSTEELTCVTPAHEPGVVDVTVINPDEGSTTYPSSYTYLDEAAPPTEPTIGGLNPSVASIEGGSEIELTGWWLDTVVEIRVNDEPVDFTFVGDTPVFTAPAGALGTTATVEATLMDDGEILASPESLRFGLVASPSIDGQRGANEWPESHLIAANTVETNWGVGLNELQTAYLAYDATHLYLGMDGRVEASTDDSSQPNALQVFLDLDFGAATGVTDCIELGDNGGSGDLDDAFSGTLVFDIEGFGADAAAGTVGMNSVLENGELSALAGWRLFSNLNEFAWINGSVVAGEDGWIEMSIPLAVLFSGPLAADAVDMALIAVVGNNYGNAFSNQCLPESETSEVSMTKTAAVTFQLLGF